MIVKPFGNIISMENGRSITNLTINFKQAHRREDLDKVVSC